MKLEKKAELVMNYEQRNIRTMPKYVVGGKIWPDPTNPTILIRPD
jgi:hypothetical protein